MRMWALVVVSVVGFKGPEHRGLPRRVVVRLQNGESSSRTTTTSGKAGTEVEVARSWKEEARGRRAWKKKARLPGSKAAKRLMRDPSYEVFSVVATVVSCGIYAVGTLDLQPSIDLGLLESEEAISTAFAAEWFVRWYSRGLDPRYAFEPLPLVDLLSFITLLPQIDGNLSFLRLLRLLRFQRILVDAETFARFRARLVSPWRALSAADNKGGPEKVVPAARRYDRKPKKWGRYSLRVPGASNQAEYQFGFRESSTAADRMREETFLKGARVFTTVCTLLFVASGCIYAAEHDVNPNFPDFFSALYFGLTTLTTVGFGDITPVTPNGRIVVCVSILVGIAVIPAQVTSLAEAIFLSANAEMLDRRAIGASGTSLLSDRLSMFDRQQKSSSLRQNDDDDDDDVLPSPTGFDDSSYDMNKNTRDNTAFYYRDRSTKRNKIDPRDDETILGSSSTRAVSSGPRRGGPCAACGQVDHLPGAAFCSQCGSPLHGDDARFSPPPPSADSENGGAGGVSQPAVLEHRNGEDDQHHHHDHTATPASSSSHHS